MPRVATHGNLEQGFFGSNLGTKRQDDSFDFLIYLPTSSILEPRVNIIKQYI
jgi:hypothetical protein